MAEEMLFVAWKWHQPGCRSQYRAEHANVWNRMVRRNYSGPLRTVLITDDPDGVDFDTYPLWDDFRDMKNPHGDHLPSCYRRLKIFSTEVTDALGVARGAPVTSMDLDVVICAQIDKMFAAEAPFLGWKRISPTKPMGYNGSMFTHRAGQMTHLWNEFDPLKSPILARRAGQYGSDQGWISYRLKGGAPGWTHASGMYSYSADVRLKRFPANARIISFNGKWKPWMVHIKQTEDWVRRYWK